MTSTAKGQYVACEKCMALKPLREFLQEVPLVLDGNSVTETIIHCQNCHYKKHICYYDESLRKKKNLLDQAVAEVTRNRTQKNISALSDAKTAYTVAFDMCQQKYESIVALEKAAVDDGRRN